MRLLFIFTILYSLFSITVSAQSSDSVSTFRYVDPSHVEMAAGAQFKASKGKQFFWGKHYRDEWITPVQFRVLNLDTIYGGLTPKKMGGGHQTKTLRLVDATGKEWVLRTIDKNLDVLIPPDFKGTVLEDIVNDQISTAHPYGPLAIAGMAEGVHILHTNPVIYFVPDNPRLEEFRPVFANKLCLLEERPSGKGWDHTAVTNDAKEILNTEELLEKVYKDNKNQVDQASLLKVRLLDMVVNDWDRHEDQWIWAGHSQKGKTSYEAFARDRDQSFSRTDGFVIYFISRPYVLRSLQHMDPTVKDVIGSNMAAKTLDRQFLNELNQQDWEQVIKELQTDLSDSVIVKSVALMPKESNQYSGEYLTDRLKSRRDNMMKFGIKYYRILNKQVTINGSEKNETFIVNPLPGKKLEVLGLSEKKDTFYHRVFDHEITKEVNIYGLGGEDEFIVGNNDNEFIIRLIGGKGENSYASSGERNGKKIRVYDSLPVFQTKKLDGNVVKDATKAFCVHDKNDSLLIYNRSAFKYDYFKPSILPEYNPDDGVFVALGFLLRKQKWGKTPFAWQQKFTADYAFATAAFGFRYEGLFKRTFGKWDLDITAYYNGPKFVLNYYGKGNNTTLAIDDKSYYRVRSKSLYVNPAATLIRKNSLLRFGLQFETVDVIKTDKKFISNPPPEIDSSVFIAKYFGGVNGRWEYTTAGRSVFPRKGWTLNAGFSFLQNLKDQDRSLLRLSASVAYYYTFWKKLTFAHRTGAATNIGDYEFYQSNTLGGSRNLRGWWRDRFAGTTSFYQNTELRYTFLNLRSYILRGQAGIFGFFDDGRVWVKNEESDKLHLGYGGGLYFIPFNLVALSLYVGSSSEVTTFNVRGALFF